MSREKVALKINNIGHSITHKNSYTVVLSEIGGNRFIPLVVGAFEAQAIAVALENMKPTRPLTHDLVKNIFDDITNNETDYKRASELSRTFDNYDFENKTGEDVYRDIQNAIWDNTYKPPTEAQKKTSLALLSYGIDGVKYPAESLSRAGQEARGLTM